MASISMSKMCRTCLVEDAEMCSIFEMNSTCNNVLYSQMIVATTGIRVSQYDGLPTVICNTCKQSATLAYLFKKQSKKADISLRSLLLNKKKPLDGIVEKSIKIEDIPEIKYEFNHHIDNDFDCSEFDITPSTDAFRELEADTKTETKTEEEADCTCTICNNSFETDEVLQTHLLSCVKAECEDIKSSFCPMCGLDFVDPQLLLKHVVDCAFINKGTEIKKKGRPRKLLSKTPKKSPTKRLKSRRTTAANNSDNTSQAKIEVSVEVTTKEANMKTLTTLSCDICHIQFDTRVELNTHYGNHNGGLLLCCNLCEKTFVEMIYFKHHMLTYHQQALTNNQYENVQDQQIDDIKSNISLSCAERTLDITDSSIKDFMKLKTLEVLLKSIDTQSDQAMEDQLSIGLCGECGQLFLSSDEKMQHNDLEHPDLSSRCNFCFKLFSSIKAAARHRKICKQIVHKHECYTCGHKFAYELTLNKHILKEHKGQSVSVNFMKQKNKKNFTCKICNKSFFREELLERHLKTHSPNIKKYECDICKKKFNRKDNLRSHMQIHDPKRAKLASNCLCLYCGRSFSNSSNLIVHMRRHTGEKPYKCDFCGKGFPRSSDLQCHRRSHTGEKPYLCNICGKGFRRNNKLSRHMRVHTGQRPYKCIYCEKAFSQSNDLTLHVRRHTGDKPYVCEICGDRFIQGTALHNHRRTHNHYPPSTSAAPTCTLGTFQPKPVRNMLPTITVKKMTDIAKLSIQNQ